MEPATQPTVIVAKGARGMFSLRLSAQPAGTVRVTGVASEGAPVRSTAVTVTASGADYAGVAAATITVAVVDADWSPPPTTSAEDPRERTARRAAAPRATEPLRNSDEHLAGSGTGRAGLAPVTTRSTHAGKTGTAP